jgi:hypothetical protein
MEYSKRGMSKSRHPFEGQKPRLTGISGNSKTGVHDLCEVRVESYVQGGVVFENVHIRGSSKIMNHRSQSNDHARE